MGELCIIKRITLTKLLILVAETTENQFVINMAAEEKRWPLKKLFEIVTERPHL